MPSAEILYLAPVPRHTDPHTIWQAVGIVGHRRGTSVENAFSYLLLTATALGIDVHDLASLVVKATNERSYAGK